MLAVNHVILVGITINEEARNIVLVAKFHCAHKRNRLVVSAVDKHRLAFAAFAHLYLDHIVRQNHAHAHQHQTEHRKKAVKHKHAPDVRRREVNLREREHHEGYQDHLPDSRNREVGNLAQVRVADYRIIRFLCVEQHPDADDSGNEPLSQERQRVVARRWEQQREPHQRQHRTDNRHCHVERKNNIDIHILVEVKSLQ